MINKKDIIHFGIILAIAAIVILALAIPLQYVGAQPGSAQTETAQVFGLTGSISDFNGYTSTEGVLFTQMSGPQLGAYLTSDSLIWDSPNTTWSRYVATKDGEPLSVISGTLTIDSGKWATNGALVFQFGLNDSLRFSYGGMTYQGQFVAKDNADYNNWVLEFSPTLGTLSQNGTVRLQVPLTLSGNPVQVTILGGGDNGSTNVSMMGVTLSEIIMEAPMPAISPAQDVCLARFTWNTDDGLSGDPFWEPPFRSDHLGTLDLRAIGDKGPGPTATGWGLFSYDQPMGSTGMHCLGGDLDAAMTVSQADTLAILLGLSAGDIRARSMRGIIRELLIDEADPTGVLRWKPFQTTRNGLIINLGGYGQIYGERFSETSQSTQNTLDVRIADYRRRVVEGVPLSQLQRQTGWDGWRIFGREPTSADLDRLLPPERRSDGGSCSDPATCTTINESFNTADGDILGPDLTWTELGGTDIDILTNEANAASSSGYARATEALAGADMYAEAEIFNQIGTTARGNSGCVRYAAAADTAYYVRTNAAGDNTFSAYDVTERTAGTDVILTTFSGFADAINGVVRVEIIGSNIEVFYNGASRGTTSDSSITGNTQVGICGRHTGTNRMRWDNFEAGDLGAAERRVIRIN